MQNLTIYSFNKWIYINNLDLYGLNHDAFVDEPYQSYLWEVTKGYLPDHQREILRITSNIDQIYKLLENFSNENNLLITYI